ncbi:hypothetical protein LPJ61_002019 [Coemansia biformis]|uniref:Uncharacterized protein n=1 Tax=Coemansia biformis TaxID=1286918 RepID=A0A9W7YDU1_9FUNG|nr:hypothetical protein LPJ61_002019 [Coemansia biformis]
MRHTAGLAVFAVLVAASGAAALPVPQFAPQGMGGYGYPMGGGPMGGGPMMGGGGPMMGGGPYGMGNQYGSMYMPGGPGGNRYAPGRMRGQRYHAHPGVDEWPMPANPYMDARTRRRLSKSAFFANGDGGMAGPMIHAPGHNRIPMNDDGDSDDEDSKAGKGADDGSGDGNTQVAGVNRVSASSDSDAARLSSLSSERAAAADANTSLDLASLSGKIINIGAFDGASTKSIATTSPARVTATASAHKASVLAHGRHTVTRSLGSHSPTPTPKARQTHSGSSAAMVTHAPGSAPVPIGGPGGVARAANNPAHAPGPQLHAHTDPAANAASKASHGANVATQTPATHARHELPLKNNIRGL